MEPRSLHRPIMLSVALDKLRPWIMRSTQFQSQTQSDSSGVLYPVQSGCLESDALTRPHIQIYNLPTARVISGRTDGYRLALHAWLDPGKCKA